MPAKMQVGLAIFPIVEAFSLLHVSPVESSAGEEIIPGLFRESIPDAFEC
jgi:hypothetical protein